MRKYMLSLALVLALVAAYAVAQQSPGQGNPAQPGAAAGQAGSGQYPQQPGAQAPSQSKPEEQAEQDRDKDRDEDKDKDKEKAEHKHKKDKDKDAQAENRSDQALEREVREQLASNPEFRNVKVEVKDRVAELSGSVPKKEDRKEAEKLAKSVQGIKRVKEHLSVNASAASMEGTASEEARESHAEEAREQQANPAGAVPANPSAAGTQAGAPQTRPSASMPGASTSQAGANVNVNTQAQNVQQAIHSDAALAANNINVSVANNQIILTGTVPSDQEKKRAEELAVAQSGGVQVINNIEVGSAAGVTSGAAGGVSGAATAPQTQPTQPPSTAGAAGSVSSQAGAQTQGTTSQGAQGTTSETGGMSPDQLKAQIQNAFQGEPTLSSCNLNTNVTADSIELSGTCPTGKEKQTARRMVQSLAGNRRVVDRITVLGRGQGENQEKPQAPPPQGPPPQF